jgi:hypothetical protein
MATVSTLTDVPARLDRLPWSGFHRLVVTALGITWILDGLEVTLAGSVAAALQTSPRLHLTAEQVGLTGSAYLIGRCWARSISAISPTGSAARSCST